MDMERQFGLGHHFGGFGSPFFGGFGSPFFRPRFFPFFFFSPFFFNPFFPFRGEGDRDGMYHNHQCKEGDSMGTLAETYNVPQPILETVNPQIQNPAVLNPGETIYVPRMHKMYCKKMYMEEESPGMYPTQQAMPYTGAPQVYPNQQMMPSPGAPEVTEYAPPSGKP
jgi:hypothetical protein